MIGIQEGEKAMKIFAYVMTYDTGFAPCVAEGKLTLACCKTNLRYKIGNLFSGAEELYLLGLCGKTLAEKCGFSKEYFYTPVYAARITDVCKTTDYYNFHRKIRCDQVYVYNAKKEKWTIGENNPHHSGSDGKGWDWQTEKDLVYLPRANSKKGVLNSVLVSTDFAHLGKEMCPRNQDLPSFLEKIAKECEKAPRSDHKMFEPEEEEEVSFKEWFCKNRAKYRKPHFLERFPDAKPNKRMCKR